MHGRHGDPGGDHSLRSGGGLVGLPEIGPREVTGSGFLPEDDLRQHAVLPLGAEEMPQFGLGFVEIEMGVADRDKARIPVPLMGIQAGGRFGERAGPILMQNAFCCGQ